VLDEVAVGPFEASLRGALFQPNDEDYDTACKVYNAMVTGIGIFRFSDEGKVVESWDNFDQLGMMRQLGAISD
jgi:hypothetical protein